MKIGFIVEGFNDEATIREVMPDAHIVLTKGTRWSNRVKQDIRKAIEICEHVFIVMDPDEPGEMMRQRIQEEFWGLTAIIVEDQSDTLRHGFMKRKIGVEHCDPEYLKKVIDKAIEDERYKNLDGYALVSQKIADGYYKNDGSLRSFENDLFAAFEVTNNPKRDRCFSLAWEHGHSSGYHEVLNYFSEFVELIK